MRAGTGHRPAAGCQRCAGVKRKQPHTRRKIVGQHIGAQTACRPDRGQYIALRVAGVQRQPLVPGAGQKRQIARAVHARQQRVIKRQRVQQRPQLAPLQLQQHLVGAGGHLKARHQLAAEHLQAALVQGVVAVVVGDHGRFRQPNQAISAPYSMD